jgi:3-hydroxyacyl-CoA dehydrogenase/enoyl-CoA hydratase/3-hydroxybutyryl-CoA epimerase
MNEAARTLNDGAELQHVDELILEFGMPMGPFTLADEVGLDVGLHVAQTLEEAYGERMKVAPALELIHDELKFLGKKQGKGFYTWNGKEKEVNERVTKALQSSVLNKNLSDTIIVERCLFIMLNEAALCLSEKIVDTPEQLDMAMIMGTGFPPFKGGLLKYADHYGIKNCVQTMENLAKDFGERFNPAPLLVEMAEQGYDFYTNRKPS